jgi:Immunoglobulin domain
MLEPNEPETIMRPKNRMGMSILAGGLAFVGTANATDLIVNGSFEDPPGVGWVGSFGTYNYSAAYFSGPPIPDSENPGSNYSWRQGTADGNFSVPCIQTVDLTVEVPPQEIDAGMGQYTFSAWLASYTANPEQPYLTVQFLDQASAPVGSIAVLDRVNSAFFTTFADGVTVFDSTNHLHSWAKYVRTGSIPPGARTAVVGIAHSPNAGLSGRPDTYVDLVKLDVVSSFETVPPSVEAANPANGTANVRPDAVVNISLRDGTSAVNTNSIQFSFDGTPLTPFILKSGTLTTIQYDPPGALAPTSLHSYRLIFNDNSIPPIRQTNESTFTVANYYNILLPTPLYLETFDATPEDTLPAGWTQVSYSAVPDPTPNLADLNSFSYSKWTVVDSERFNSPLLSYNSHDPTDDYQRVLSINPNNVVNGAVVEHLASHNIAFGDSGYRDGGYQVVYLFSKDFDLTGQQNVYLSFHSLWEQNQDSIGAVEYSVDEGATWLPIVYYLDGPDILRDASGNIDALATFTNVNTDPFQATATYIDPVDLQAKGGYYGAFIGVASNQWANLGPYISERLNDDPVESKRVEVFRLPAADNKPKVRLRFAHAGTDSWYFGVDDVGLYSITTVTPPNVALTPASQTAGSGNSATITASTVGVGPFTYQWKHDGVNVSGQTSPVLRLTNVQLADAGNYTVEIGYQGGSTTYGVSVLTVINSPSFVIGQWDFNTPDLSASCGQALEFSDLNVDFNTGFGPSDFFDLPLLDGQVVNVMQFPGTLGGPPMSGYRMRHGLSGNGGGTNVNQYTLIMDLIYPPSSDNQWRSLLQTDPNNGDDAEFFISNTDGLGINAVYQGSVISNTWYRLALAVDLSGPGPNPIVAKFINGVKVAEQTLPAGRDGRWSLSGNPDSPYALLFADNDTDVQPGFVSSIQLRSGRLSDAAVASLGGPSAKKIPGCIRISHEAGNIIIRWTGGVPLQSADLVTGPWADVAGATSPYTVPLSGARKFYRPKL